MVHQWLPKRPGSPAVPKRGRRPHSPAGLGGKIASRPEAAGLYLLAASRSDRHQGSDAVDQPSPTFGEQLRRLRLQQGLSLREFERKTHHSKSLVCEWENGRKVPDPGAAARLDHLLDAGGQLVSAAATSTPAASVHLASEVTRHYAHQGAVAAEIRRSAVDASELDVLAVRGLGLLGLNDSLLRPALMARKVALQVRCCCSIQTVTLPPYELPRSASRRFVRSRHQIGRRPACGGRRCRCRRPGSAAVYAVTDLADHSHRRRDLGVQFRRTVGRPRVHDLRDSADVPWFLLVGISAPIRGHP